MKTACESRPSLNTGSSHAERGAASQTAAAISAPIRAERRWAELLLLCHLPLFPDRRRCLCACLWNCHCLYVACNCQTESRSERTEKAADQAPLKPSKHHHIPHKHATLLQQLGRRGYPMLQPRPPTKYCTMDPFLKMKINNACSKCLIKFVVIF